MRKFIYLKEIIFLFLLSLTPFLWVGSGYIILGHDSGFRLNIQHHMQMLWNTFNPTINTGVDWSLYKGFLIIQLPEYILQTVFDSLQSAQPFILFFWFFVMAISMYIAMLYLFPEKKQWFIRLYVSVFWVFNFYILQAWFIAERAKFSLYAALPLSIVIFFAVFRKKIKIFTASILFGLLYFLCNGGGSPPLFGASFVVWLITWSYLSISSVRNKKDVFRTISIGISFGVMFFLFNAYWILPQIDLIRGKYTSAVSAEGGVDGLIAWEREISKYASIPNLLRLQGLPDWYANPVHPYANIFLKNPLLIILSFVPVICILIGIIFCRKSRLVSEYKVLLRLVFLLLIIGLFFSSGSHAPTGFIYLQLMRRIPGFAIFRSSLFKFAPVFWFSLIFLSGFYLNIFLERFRKLSNMKVFVIIGIILYHFPFFYPTFFNFSQNFTTRVKVPSYVTTIAGKLDNDQTRGRVLLLPELDKGFINKPIDTYTWGYYSLDVLPRVVSNRIFIANDSPYEIVQALYDAIYSGQKDKFLNLAGVLNITQVLYRSDVKFSESARQIPPLDSLLGKSEFEQGSWKIYTLPDLKQKNQPDITALINVQNDSQFVSTTTATIQTSWEEVQNIPVKEIVFQAECFYCARNEYQNFIESINLPPVRKFPGKNIQLTTIDSVLSYQMQKLAEYIANKNHSDLTEYIKSMSQLSNLIQDLKGRDADYYLARVTAFLQRQYELGDSDIHTAIDPLFSTLKDKIWVSDETDFKYGITLPIDGNYLVQVDDDRTQAKFYTAGYHQLNIPKNGKDKINVYFILEKQMPETAKSKKLIIYPYSFDTRWQVEGLPKLTNGYANGWIIQNDQNNDVSPYYAPQSYFFIGVFITVSSLGFVTVLLLSKKI